MGTEVTLKYTLKIREGTEKVVKAMQDRHAWAKNEKYTYSGLKKKYW